ncbi:MAG: glutamate mutase L, partial [Betaproteobacteria bacterium]|nr:glutamate mutase L [Betaproteobacteria bacterium]
RQLKPVVGTGGIFAYGKGYKAVLESVTHGDPMKLKPVHPQYWIDRRYILYGMGLLAERFPDVAYTVLRENLEEI